MDELLKNLDDIDTENLMATVIYPRFRVRVGVIKNLPPRHQFFEDFRDLGLKDIDRVFSGGSFRGSNLCFVFPERWMSVKETVNFMQSLHNHPDALAGRITRVDLITSSAVMLTDFPNESMRVIQFPALDAPYLFKSHTEIS